MPWLELFGWLGSAILIVSMMQQRIMRLRAINLVGCVIHIIYNSAIGAWPIVGLNAVLAAIQVVSLYRLVRSDKEGHTYRIVPTTPKDPYLSYLLSEQAADIKRFNPEYGVPDASTDAFLLMRGTETVGYVLTHDDGNGVAQIDLDYVTEKYRDFTPGKFLFIDSRWFNERGYRAVRTAPNGPDYYEKIGFVRAGRSYIKEFESRPA